MQAAFLRKRHTFLLSLFPFIPPAEKDAILNLLLYTEPFQIDAEVRKCVR